MKNILSRKEVLITGGSGFIGSNLVRRLINLNCNVHLILRKSSDLWRIKDLLGKITIYHVDLLERNKLSRIVDKINPNYIIHLATYSNYRNQTEIQSMVDVNIRGTMNLLLASKNINYKLFINTGSSSEYGIKNRPMSETDSLTPISFYAATKASATHLCQTFSEEHQKPIVTLRPFSVFGPYEEKNRFMPTIIRAIINNKSIQLTSGNQRRDFIFIEDVIDIYIKCLFKGKELSGQILNAGTGMEYTNDYIIKTLFRITGKRVKLEKGAYPKRLWDAPHWVANTSRLKKILSWKPKFTLAQGLRYTYKWFEDGQV